MARAQTNLDFTVGTTIFLLTVAFVFLFVPNMLAPFQPAEGKPLQADRTANHLVETTFEGSDGRVASPCVVAFFANETADGCPYEPEPLRDAVGLHPRSGVRVRVLNDSGVATLDGTTLSRTTGTVGDSTVTTRRVRIDGDPHRVRVEVW